jgi:hypothetical protein
MTVHQFTLKLDTASEIEPQVRMWIDDQQNGDLTSEQEVQLCREEEAGWSAAFSADGPFMYRVGIVAAPGTRWSLSFRAGDDELLFDSDELTMTKEWLLGTCEALSELPVRGLAVPAFGSELRS